MTRSCAYTSSVCRTCAHVDSISTGLLLHLLTKSYQLSVVPVADGHSVRMVVGQVLSHWLGHLPVPWTSKSLCSCRECFWIFTSVWSCRHLTGNWRRLGADPPLPGNYSWSPSRRDGGWSLLYPHSRRSVSTKITPFLVKQKWPTHERFSL